MNVKAHSLLLALAMLQIEACKERDVPAPYDPSFVLSGRVLDSRTSAGIEGVTVGWRDPDIPDSVLFNADSLLPFSKQTVPLTSISSPGGSFTLYFYPGVRDTSRYWYLFAYKPGYRLWRFDRQPVGVTQASRYLDHCDIVLNTQ